ncbi:MAG: hypothetical protein C4560_03055 [Nitrospiraceae bacterium]|nr:MAG: hypothetical protein C4560_03055 [Nitrospiraceae bacterium]
MSELAIALKDFALVLQTLGPWGIVFFLWWDGKKESKKWEERHQAVVKMYENNIELVKSYENLSCDQQGMITMNTAAITELTTIIKERIK